MKQEHRLDLAKAAIFAIHDHLENLDRLEARISSLPVDQPRHTCIEQVYREQSRIRRYIAAQMALGISVGELAMLTEVVGAELDAMSLNKEKEIPLPADAGFLEQVAGEEYASAFIETIKLANEVRLRDGKKPFWHEDDDILDGVGRVEGNVIYPDVFHRRAACCWSEPSSHRPNSLFLPAYGRKLST